jgi:transglutaminase-like putative cysteine protease
MRLCVTHTTDYSYEPAVSMAQHMAHLLPRETPVQRVRSAALQIDPKPTQLREVLDAFGNRRTFFSLPDEHESLLIRASCMVDTGDPLLSGPSPLTGQTVPRTATWESVSEHFLYRSGAAWDPATEFVFASTHIPLQTPFVDYARKSFAPGRPLLEAAVDLMQRIHRDFKYEGQSTDIHTPAAQALEMRKGVCQDFAHVLIACLRSLGLAARYVSGYLLTTPPPGKPRLIGADASHAWASVYVPDEEQGRLQPRGRWFDLDPTNNRWGLNAPGEDFVTLALGRDFADVSPVRGVIFGGASHTLKVGVTVRPL